MLPSNHQTGVALITALLIVALATVVAASVATRLGVDIRKMEVTLNYDRAQLQGRGLEAWAIGLLKSDGNENQYDHLKENWSLANLDEEIPGGRISGAITELNGCFNINNLVKEGQPVATAIERLEQLVTRLELSEEIIAPIVDWLDADQQPLFPTGAEDDYYQALAQPYRTANREIASVSELRLIKGMSEESYNTLRPHLCALPGNTHLNINTANQDVILAWLPMLSESDIELLLETRQETPFENLEAFLEHPVVKGKVTQESGIDVSSRYFLIHGSIKVGSVKQRLQTLLYRQPESTPIIVYRSGGNEPIPVAINNRFESNDG